MANEDSTSSETIEQLKKDLRSEMSTKAATWAIAGGIAVFAFAALGAWGVLKPQIIKELGITEIPRGTVVAFDRDDLDPDKCPPGWEAFKAARARVIVGAGDPSQAPGKLGFDENSIALTQYVLGEYAGEEKHTLRIEEMPKHMHGFTEKAPEKERAGSGQYSGTGTLGRTIPVDREAETEWIPEKNATPHNNMPPYIALYFCKKKAAG